MNYTNILNEINRLKELKKKLLTLDNKYANDQCSILDNKINELEKQIYSSDIDRFENNNDDLIKINFDKRKIINNLIEENKKLDIQIKELNKINQDKLDELKNKQTELENTKSNLELIIINNNKLLLKIEDEKSKVFSNFNIIDIKNKEIDKLKKIIKSEEEQKYNYLEKFNTYFEINLKLLNEIDLLNIKIEEYKNIYKNKKNKNKDILELNKDLKSNIINLNEKLQNINEKIPDLKINIYQEYLINKQKYNELNLLFIKNDKLDKEYKHLIYLNEYYQHKIKQYLDLSLNKKITEKELLIIEVIKIKEKNQIFFEKLEKSINKIKNIDDKLKIIINNLENRFKININNFNNNFIYNYVEKLIIENTTIDNIENNTTLLYMLNNYGCNYILFNDYIKNIKNKSNGIVIDIEFYKNANYLEIKDNFNIYQDILYKGVIEGYLYCSKQFYKLFPNHKLTKIDNLLFVSQNINLKDFLKDNLYNKDFDYFINKFEILEISGISQTELTLFVFIGYRDRGIDLINKINNYYQYQKYNLVVILNNKDNYDLIEKINCKNRIVYKTDDYGNDIIPTLIAYNDVKNKIKINYIIKLQTKYNITFFNNVINYLLDKNLENLIEIKNNHNCIGHPNYIGTIETDKFYNSLLMIKYQKYIDINKHFIGGTMFFCHKIVFDKIIDFMKNNNYRSYFVNNLYDTNSVNKLASPVHFLERLFGLIR